MDRKIVSQTKARLLIAASSVLVLALVLSSCARELKEIIGPVGFDEDHRPIILTEGWQRYPGLLSEGELSANEAYQTTIAVPMVSPIATEAYVPAGPLSYRMTIKTKEETANYALFLPNAARYAAIEVNGQAIYIKGRDAEPGSDLTFAAAGPELSILLRSEADGPRLEDPGLMPRLILFGEEKALLDFQILATGIAALQTGFFLIGALFMFILFLFWRKNRDFLALAAFLASACAFSIYKSGSFYGLFAFPRVAVSIYALASASLLVFFLALLVYAVFPGKFPKLFRLPTLLIPLLLAASAALLLYLPDLEALLYIIVSAYIALFIVVVIVRIAILAIKGNGRALWFCPALLLAALTIGLHRFFPASFVAAVFVESAGLTLFAFIAMLMLVKKIGDSFESTENLTDYVSNVTSTMKRFIPREFLECLDKDDVIDLRLGDHVKKEMTIFFSDIRAFTELSEKLTVEENFAFINSYLSRMVPIVTDHGGFVDKYIGDGIMALFSGDEGPDKAIRTAIAMQEKIVEYNVHRASVGYRPIAMGVGVHTGDLMLGVIGVNDRMENTVISDAVNLASRLQAITKAFNVSLAISEQAFKELEDPGVYKYRFIGKVKVKGKAAPVSVFEIFDGIEASLFERKMRANTYFEQGMLSYYQKDFSGAMYYFKRVLEIIPEDGAAVFYLENCINKASV